MKCSDINAAPSCFENTLKDFSSENTKKSGLYEYI